MFGSIQSWLNTEPEAAIHAFQQHDAIRVYLKAKLKQYATPASRGARIGDRVEAATYGLKHWDDIVSRYQQREATQIATELKRQRDAVERYKKSKSPRPSSFAYVPKSAWRTKDKLDVLTASGADTKDLHEELTLVHRMVVELADTLEPEALAKSNGYLRDGYRLEDRSQIETFVRRHWLAQNSDTKIVRIVMPKQAWSNTYGATWDEENEAVLPYEVERLTVYVATQKTPEILTLHPIRLRREHYKVNGKRLDKIGPQQLQLIPTNEFAFDVFAKNIR